MDVYGKERGRGKAQSESGDGKGSRYSLIRCLAYAQMLNTRRMYGLRLRYTVKACIQASKCPRSRKGVQGRLKAIQSMDKAEIPFHPNQPTKWA